MPPKKAAAAPKTPKAKAAKPKAATPRKKKAAATPGSAGIAAAACLDGTPSPALTAACALVEQLGGVVAARYREPLGGHWVALAVLPIEKVEATPYQRELSPTHAERLATVIPKVGRFLDPIVAVPSGAGFHSPNGMHRLAAMRALGARAITALIVPEPEVAFRILALNTEKAHNLKDKALEVIRMARALAQADGTRREASFAVEFEAPELLTLGIVYEKNPRFGGGAYSPFLKKVDRFAERPLATALRDRQAHAARLVAIEADVKRIVMELSARGLKSPYLRNYVIARINPVRFHKAKKGDTGPAMPIAQAFVRMAASARKFDAGRVSSADLAWVAAGAESAE